MGYNAEARPKVRQPVTVINKVQCPLEVWGTSTSVFLLIVYLLFLIKQKSDAE